MRFFRYTDHSFKDLEAIDLDQLDLKNKRTLFIFPGADNPSPNFPPPADYDHTADPDKYRKVKHLLDLGICYTQDAMNPGDEPYQVVIANWDGTKEKPSKMDVTTECLERLQQAKDHPSTYVSPEAEQFVQELYEQDFKPANITMMGWSYGTGFIQECANDIRIKGKEKKRRGKDELKETEQLPPIHAVCTATVADIATCMQYGFPGFYMYSRNDKVLERYTSPTQRALYESFLEATDVIDNINPHNAGMLDEEHHLTKGFGKERYKGTCALVTPPKRPDQTFAVLTTPTRCLINRRVPVSYEELNEGIRMRYKAAGEEPSDRPHKPEVVLDPEGHKPGLFMMALPGSKYIEEIPGNGKYMRRKTTEASEHTRYFRRALQNILTRSGRLSFEGMLLDETKEQNLFQTGLRSDHVTREIMNRLEFVEINPEAEKPVHMIVDPDRIPGYKRDKLARKNLKRFLSDDEIEELRTEGTLKKVTNFMTTRYEMSRDGRHANVTADVDRRQKLPLNFDDRVDDYWNRS